MIENHKKYNFDNILEFIKPQIVNLQKFLDANIRDKIEIYCGNCGKICSHKKRDVMSKFVQRFNLNKKYKRCCSQQCYNKMRGHTPKENKNCLNCQSTFISSGIRKFCSQKCSALYTKNKCGTKRSYNEKYFYELILKSFPDAVHNEFIFNGYDADIIIPSIKLAVHWNGLWHYKTIINEEKFHKIQKRDAERYHEIEKCGYQNYVIKDDCIGKNFKFVEKEFDIFLKKWSSWEGIEPSNNLTTHQS